MLKSSDKSKQVNWTVRRSTDVTLTLTFTSSGVYNTSILTLTALVQDLNGNTVITPTVSNGGATGIVTLSLTNTQTNIIGNSYFWSMKTTTPIDSVLLQGIFTVNDFLFDSGNVSSSGSVLVDIGGTEVTISMTTS